MKPTVVVYGSSTGTCASIAQAIAEKLGVKAIDAAELNADTIKDNNTLTLGKSTCGAGEMQDGWYEEVKVIKAEFLAGKTVAVFGCGDSEAYSDTFCGGMKELYDAAKAAGAHMIGAVDATDYSFEDSDAAVDGQFVGLALDDVNEDDKTAPRIDAWIEEIKPNL